MPDAGFFNAGGLQGTAQVLHGAVPHGGEPGLDDGLQAFGEPAHIQIEGVENFREGLVGPGPELNVLAGAGVRALTAQAQAAPRVGVDKFIAEGALAAGEAIIHFKTALPADRARRAFAGVLDSRVPLLRRCHIQHVPVTIRRGPAHLNALLQANHSFHTLGE